MRKFQLILLTLILYLPLLFGQSAQGRYASRMTSDGTIVFIDPHKLSNLTNIKRFEYDMTLLSWTDSVTINFTFESKFMSLPKNLKISSCNKQFSCTDFSSLFIDIKKKHYEIRITSKFSINELEQILNCESSPVFSFIQEDLTETASYSPKAWMRDRKKLLDIFKIYLYSKK